MVVAGHGRLPLLMGPQLGGEVVPLVVTGHAVVEHVIAVVDGAS